MDKLVLGEPPSVCASGACLWILVRRSVQTSDVCDLPAPTLPIPDPDYQQLLCNVI